MPAFVDSNVLVYSRDATDRTKHVRARQWLKHLWETKSGRLSTQVLNEYYTTVTRKISPGISRTDARSEIADFQAWGPLATDLDLIRSAWTIEDRYKFAFWDALIVAGAKAARCDRLLTEDLTDGQDLDGVLVVNPFEHEPS